MGAEGGVVRKPAIKDDEFLKACRRVNREVFGGVFAVGETTAGASRGRIVSTGVFVEIQSPDSGFGWTWWKNSSFRRAGKIPGGGHGAYGYWAYDKFESQVAFTLRAKIVVEGHKPRDPTLIGDFSSWFFGDFEIYLKDFPDPRRAKEAKRQLWHLNIERMPEALKPYAGPLEVPEILLEDLEIVAKSLNVHPPEKKT